MPWNWRLQKSDGGPVNGTALPEETFTTQADAETWLGEKWRELREAGVEQVTLVEDDTVVYPMSLHEHDPE